MLLTALLFDLLRNMMYKSHFIRDKKKECCKDSCRWTHGFVTSLHFWQPLFSHVQVTSREVLQTSRHATLAGMSSKHAVYASLGATFTLSCPFENMVPEHTTWCHCNCDVFVHVMFLWCSLAWNKITKAVSSVYFFIYCLFETVKCQQLTGSDKTFIFLYIFIYKDIYLYLYILVIANSCGFS